MVRGDTVKRIGVALIIIAIILWIVFPISAIFMNTEPNEGLIISAFVIGLLGGVSVLIGVIIDRYKEHKEDQINDDYRKY